MQIKNIEIIKESEKLELVAYLPTKDDVWTIGYGHTKTAKKGMVITEAKAEELLEQDLAWVNEAINKYITVPVNQDQVDALGSLIFNIGSTNFSKSTVLRKLNQKDYIGAADAFLMWNKQKSKTTGKMVVLDGLTKRRKEERELFNG
jgi:lysozyme